MSSIEQHLEHPKTAQSAVEQANDRAKAVRALEIQTWTIAFETILEKMSEGLPFDQICKDYQTPANTPVLQPARVRAWIFANERRRNAYLVAKSIGAEAIEDDLLRISDGLRPDGSVSLDDVPRSQLRINTRKWLLGVWNRDRYGDVKKVESTMTSRIDPSLLPTDDLRSRLLQNLGLLGDESGQSVFDQGEGDTGE
jgi:hypothetical protein